MIYKIELSKKAKKDLKNLDISIQKKIIKKLEKLKLNLDLGKKLSNILKDYYKIKVGKYRIIYFLEDKKIFIVRIGHRKNIYDSKRNKLLKSSNNLEEKIIIVNQLDEIIDYKDRYIFNKKDIYRVSNLIIKNSKNQILLNTKSNNSKLWNFSFISTNLKEESYIDNILKNTQEEINLIIADFELKFIDKCFVNKLNNKYFASIFLVNIDNEDIKDLNLDLKESEWVSKIKFEKIIKNNKNKDLDFFKKLLKCYDI